MSNVDLKIYLRAGLSYKNEAGIKSKICDQSREKETSHTTIISLSIVEYIEFIYELIGVVASFGYYAEISHQAKVVTLLKKIKKKI